MYVSFAEDVCHLAPNTLMGYLETLFCVASSFLTHCTGNTPPFDGAVQVLAGERGAVKASGIGSFMWAAPEMLKDRQCTPAADMWSFGTILWELVTGERPINRQTPDPKCAHVLMII